MLNLADLSRLKGFRWLCQVVSVSPRLAENPFRQAFNSCV